MSVFLIVCCVFRPLPLFRVDLTVLFVFIVLVL